MCCHASHYVLKWFIGKFSVGDAGASILEINSGPNPNLSVEQGFTGNRQVIRNVVNPPVLNGLLRLPEPPVCRDDHYAVFKATIAAAINRIPSGDSMSTFLPLNIPFFQ